MIISVFGIVENIVGKGEIACTSNFSFFYNVFQKASFPDMTNGVIEWEWVRYLPNDKILDQSKWKAFAGDKINVTEKIEICFVKTS